MTTPSRPMDEWSDRFAREAYRRLVPGPQIGDALAEVDAHCADSGQSPQEAFGDPVTYAETVASGQSRAARDRRRRLPWIGGVRTLATLTGVLCVLDGTDAVVHGTRATVTAGELAAVAFGTAAVVLIIATVLRPGRRQARRPAAALAVAAGLAAAMLPQILWPGTVAEVSGPALLGVGLVLLAWTWWPLAAGRIFDDRIVDPRTGTNRFPVPRWLPAAVRWAVPAVVLCAALLILIVPTPPPG